MIAGRGIEARVRECHDRCGDSSLVPGSLLAYVHAHNFQPELGLASSKVIYTLRA